MRSLLRALLLFLATLILSDSAEAAIPNLRDITNSRANIEGNTGLFMKDEDDVGNTAKRYLRSSAKTTGQLKDEDLEEFDAVKEERVAVPSFIKNLNMDIKKWFKASKVN